MRNIVLFGLVAVFVFGCSKDAFNLDSKWTAPLVKAELSIIDLLPDSIVKSNSDNSLDLVYEYNYNLNNLEDVLVIPDKIDTLEANLTSLVLEDRSFTDTLTLFELYPASILLHNKTAVIPAQDVQTDEGTVLDVTDQFFKSAKFIEGYIDIEITNDLPVEAEIMEFQLLNSESQEVIIDGLIEDLQPFGTALETFDLAGKEVEGVLELKVKRVKTAASASEVLVDVYKGLRITFTVRDLKPEYATAIFPEQNLIEQKDEIKYSFGGAELTHVVIETGAVLLKVESTLEEALVLDYEIPLSTKPNAAGPIKQQWTIPAAMNGETVYVEERFPIDGYSIILKGEDPNVYPTFNHIFSTLIGRTVYSGEERTLSLDDKIRIEFGLIDVKPKLIIGDPGQHELSIKDTFAFDALSDIYGRISLEDVNLNLEIENGFGIEALVNIKDLKGINTRENKTVKLTSTELDEPILIGKAVNGVEFVPGKVSVGLNTFNSNIKPFVENLPNEIATDIDVVIRPNATIDQGDFAFNFSTLNTKLSVEAPLAVGIDSVYFRSEQQLNWCSEQVNNIGDAELVLIAVNDFPFNMSLVIDFVDENGNVVTSVSDQSNVINAAEIDPISGKTIGSSESELSLKLSSEEFSEIRNRAIKAVLKPYFNSTDAKRSTLFSDYKLGLKVIANVTYEGNF